MAESMWKYKYVGGPWHGQTAQPIPEHLCGVHCAACHAPATLMLGGELPLCDEHHGDPKAVRRSGPTPETGMSAATQGDER